MFPYSRKFYENRQCSLVSAREVVPLVLKMIQPKSIVDFGCGTGEWLSVGMEYGVEDILGVDGSWVDKELLLIPRSAFLEADLTRPLNLGRAFDMAISVEVAEHISGKYENVFMDSLTRSAPVVLFSADIPHGGGKGHINERWQDYWADLFLKRDFVAIDCIRPEIWKNQKVQWWYRQNTFLFVKKDYLDGHALLREMFKSLRGFPLNIVHPVLFEEMTNPRTMSLRKAILAIPHGALRVVKKFIKGAVT